MAIRRLKPKKSRASEGVDLAAVEVDIGKIKDLAAKRAVTALYAMVKKLVK